MAVTGALLSLWITHSVHKYFQPDRNHYADRIDHQNGILIVEFANQRKEEGLSVRDAVLGCSNIKIQTYPDDNPGNDLWYIPIALSLGKTSGSRTSLGLWL